MIKKFPEITISGEPDERGFQHGKGLADKIRKTVEFYTRIFGKSEKEIFELANHFKGKIQEFHKEYAIEIESIAEGADLNPMYIYALNSRSEFLSLDPNECTAIYFQSTRILGQNWDWAKELEEMTVLMKIEQSNGHTIRMITEPGIIGKIGMNSCGIGVCLNILRINKSLDGVPIHIVLRSVLDSKNINEATDRIKASGNGKASNILVGDRNGDCLNVEFAGDESLAVKPENDALIHTNHYLGRDINPDKGVFRCSYSRMRTAKEKVNAITGQSIEEMKAILLDRSNEEFPINRRYIPDNDVEELGTVCTIIMDLVTQSIHLKKGHTSETDFVVYKL